MISKSTVWRAEATWHAQKPIIGTLQPHGCFERCNGSLLHQYICAFEQVGLDSASRCMPPWCKRAALLYGGLQQPSSRVSDTLNR